MKVLGVELTKQSDYVYDGYTPNGGYIRIRAERHSSWWLPPDMATVNWTGLFMIDSIGIAVHARNEWHGHARAEDAASELDCILHALVQGLSDRRTAATRSRSSDAQHSDTACVPGAAAGASTELVNRVTELEAVLRGENEAARHAALGVLHGVSGPGGSNWPGRFHEEIARALRAAGRVVGVK